MQIIFNPFVNSIIPEIKPDENEVGIFNKLKIGLIKLHKILSKLLVFIIFKITEKSTTNPPISRIVFIEFVILFPIIPPKLDNVISFILLDSYFCKLFFLLFYISKI